jgi:hypothetical protein
LLREAVGGVRRGAVLLEILYLALHGYGWQMGGGVDGLRGVVAREGDANLRGGELALNEVGEPGA